MKTKVFLTAVLLAILSITLNAQEKVKKFGFELNSGVSFATAEQDLKTGFSFEGMFLYNFMPHTGLYAGWGWNRFAGENVLAGNDFEETGYFAGLQFKHPVANSPVSWFIRAGGLWNHIEIENAEGDVIKNSGHGPGFQLAGGIALPLGKNWSLTPGVKFNALTRDFDSEGIITKMDYDYISVRIGIVKNF